MARSSNTSYGRALEQAAIARKFGFPCVMMLPCGDPRDAVGLERGYREIAEAANAGGCGLRCLAPALTQSLFSACEQKDFERALEIRERFMPHEDLRDAYQPRMNTD